MTRILLVGATGFLGKAFLSVSKEMGLEVEVLMRTDSLKSEEKRKLVEGFKVREGDLADADSLQQALQGVDVVISIVGGLQVDLQLNLIKAAKQNGVKRVVPSEFGFQARPGVVYYEGKNAVRKALEESGIEWTAIQANAIYETFGAGLFNAGPLSSPVQVHGDGSCQGVLNTAEDIARYTYLAAQDPRAVNQDISVSGPANVFKQNDLIALWEQKSGTKVERAYRSHEELKKTSEDSYAAGKWLEGFLAQLYLNFVEGYVQTAQGQLEAHELYPQVKYKTVSELFEEANKQAAN